MNRRGCPVRFCYWDKTRTRNNMGKERLILVIGYLKEEEKGTKAESMEENCLQFTFCGFFV